MFQLTAAQILRKILYGLLLLVGISIIFLFFIPKDMAPVKKELKESIQERTVLSFRDRLLLELDFFRKSIELEIRTRELKTLLQKEHQAAQKMFALNEEQSLLSEDLFPKILQIEIDFSDLDSEEQKLKDFLAFVEKGEGVVIKFKKEDELKNIPVSPFWSFVVFKHRPSRLLMRRSAAETNKRVVSEQQPQWETLPSVAFDNPVASNWFSEMIIGSIKFVLDIISFMISNKEVFLVVFVVLGLIIGAVTVYSLHFR